MAEERRSSSTISPRRKAEWLTVLAAVTAAGVVLQLHQPPAALLGNGPFAGLAAPEAVPASASADAFGKSRGVKLRVALPSETVEFPLEVDGDPSTVSYSWVRSGSDSLTEIPRAIGAKLVAPAAPGMYHLALVRGAERRIVDEVTVAVMVPFAEKLGATLNGYRIGTYLAERIRGRGDAPEGFIEIGPQDLELPVTKHLRVSDFVTHDGQDTWPRYVALDPKLLDKLELVIAEVKRLQGVTDTSKRVLSMDVHSGFRTPSHNRAVRRAARDSRHQYGDAADVAIDADFDGRFTAADSRLVALAVEMVEEDHPELKGGMGVYTSRRYRTPYVHIDARGRRARWRG